MPTKRIAVVLVRFPTVSETFIVNQIISLLDRGYHITILSLHKENNAVIHQAIKDYGLLDKVLYFVHPSPSIPKRIFQVFRFFLTAQQINWSGLLNMLSSFSQIRKNLNLWNFFNYQFILFHSFDLYHVHWANYAHAVAMAKKLNIHQTPVLVSFHGLDIIPARLSAHRREYALLQEQVKCFTVNSPYTEDLVRQVFSEQANIVLLRESLQTEHFLPSQAIRQSKEAIQIVFVGRLVPFKGPDIAVRIINELVNRQHIRAVQLLIIGDGEMMERVKCLIADFNLSDYILLLGAQSQEQIRHILSNADIFLLPGITEPLEQRAENQGLVIQEAQSMEIPVVVSDAGGMKYGMVDGVTGFVVPEGDVSGFAHKIKGLIDSEELRVRMGKAGREFVVKQFDAKSLAEKLEAIYQACWSD